MESINNNILVDYNIIVDTDVGLYYLLQSKYNNPEYIKTEMLTLDKPGAVIKLMWEREDLNPLKMFLKDDYIDNADKLYNELLNTEGEFIDLNSNLYKTFNMFLTFSNTNLIDISVFCKNEQQENTIKQLFRNSNKLNIIKYEKLEDIDISRYDSIYIKNFRDILKFKNLYKKNIYIPTYQFNLESNFKSDIYNSVIKNRMPIMDICIVIGKMNKIELINMY